MEGPELPGSGAAWTPDAGIAAFCLALAVTGGIDSVLRVNSRPRPN
jgi:hypothetical protein